MPHNVEGLLFDLGGVVIDIDFERVFRSWESLSKLPIEEIERRFTMDAAYEQHERGEIDASEYFAHLRNVLELEGSREPRPFLPYPGQEKALAVDMAYSIDGRRLYFLGRHTSELSPDELARRDDVVIA